MIMMKESGKEGGRLTEIKEETHQLGQQTEISVWSIKQSSSNNLTW